MQDRDSPVPPTPINTSAGISSQQRKASNVSASSANVAGKYCPNSDLITFY